MNIFKKVSISLLVPSLVLGFVLPATVVADDNLTPANLGMAGNFVILAKTGISNTGSSYVVGDLGLSPAAATYITGFSLILPASGSYSTSSLVNGKIYAPGYANPTPVNLTTAVLDMQNAYTDLAGRDADVTELGAGNIGGRTITPGVYKWSTGVTIPTDVTLSGTGDASDMWIFQIAQGLNVSSGAKVILSGGAQPGNIFWVVGGQTTLGTTSVLNGNILDQTAIVMNTGATLNGRALAQTAVTLDSNPVTIATSSVIALSASNSYQYPTPAGTPSNNSGAAGSYGSSAPATTNNTSASAATNVAGCTGTSGFNTLTGQACSGASASVKGGCNGPLGFSTVTGERCLGNTSGPSAAGKYNFGLTTLKSGSTGSGVIELQRFLNAKLNLGLTLDGKLGPKTVAVIRMWQASNGLVADGLIGVKTKAMMNAMAQ